MTTQAIIQNSAEELHKRINEHVQLLCFAFSENITEGKINVCCCSGCFYKHRFKETIAKVIETLESTKKAFKSKQMVSLCKELIMDLAEEKQDR